MRLSVASSNLGSPRSQSRRRSEQVRASFSASSSGERLRGASLQHVLKGFGKLWSSAVAERSDYESSMPCDRVNTFISHDWSTPHRSKLLALLVHFNLQSACVCALAVGFLVSILKVAFGWPAIVESESRAPLPGNVEGRPSINYWCLALGTLVFWLTFLCKQRLLANFRQWSWTVFIDKLCIDQSSWATKSKGVRNIGEFLLQSDSLLILLSPDYFRRLWCVFELCTFMHLTNPDFTGMRQPQTLFVAPVDMSVAIVVLILGGFFATLVSCEATHSEPLYSVYNYQLAMMPFYLYASYVIFRFQKSVTELPHYLANFKVTDAECRCCSANHVDARTGAAIVCDRQIIYEVVDEHFSIESKRNTSQGLAAFNADVRIRMLASLHEAAFYGYCVRFSYSQMLSVSMGLLLHAMDEVSAAFWFDYTYGVQVLLDFGFFCGFVVPSSLWFLAGFLHWLGTFRFNALPCVLLCTLGTSAFQGLLWLPSFTLAPSSSINGLVLQMVWQATAAGLVLVCLFNTVTPALFCIVLYRTL
eukprot:TRINITY_DN21830_c0_g1_i1.p1 TRINITY_DN21830_c0_g1~~TRINITY_DN21830_c0_g1_i1.p1  ORF type:complete len:531 (-),score=53.55 TRINITY_DN21830_c0_g1_i1:75-1667(-)